MLVFVVLIFILLIYFIDFIGTSKPPEYVEETNRRISPMYGDSWKPRKPKQIQRPREPKVQVPKAQKSSSKSVVKIVAKEAKESWVPSPRKTRY